MSILSTIKDFLGGAVGDAVSGGIPEIPGLQEAQDLVGGATEAVAPVTDGVTEAVATATEQGQASADGITQKLGL